MSISNSIMNIYKTQNEVIIERKPQYESGKHIYLSLYIF